MITNRPRALPLSLVLLLSLTAVVNARQPNVILIYTDDQGSVDVNCFGADDLITPHLDSLAQRGVRFTQFYSAAPLCSPSRAAVLTGRYPQRAGVPSNIGSKPGSLGMPSDEVTLAEMFKAAGYQTAHIGKWHLGYTPATMPNAQGFDESFGHMGGCIDNYSHFFYWSGPNRHDLFRDGREIFYDGEFFPELMVKETRRFMEANRDQPFFIYWATNLPHYPLQGSAKWREKYRHLNSPRDMYAAFVSTMDEMIGAVLTDVEELGLSEDTIIVFQSDHGHSHEERTFGGGGSAGPYRGAKGSLFEGGTRVPAIISWPGKLPKNQVRGQMATSLDWLPTLAALAGVKLPQRKLDGKNITAVIQSADTPSPHEVFHWQLGRGVGGGPQWAVRQGPWKLIGHPRDTSGKTPLSESDKLFLVNLESDIAEANNVATQHAGIVARLTQLHEAWLMDLANSSSRAPSPRKARSIGR